MKRERDEECEIPLTNSDLKVKVSAEHYEELKKYKWHTNSKGYAVARIKSKSVRMHRFIMKVLQDITIPKGMEIDHIDNNRLNNSAENLRVVTHQQNCANKKKREGTTSTYFGVTRTKGKYYAHLYQNGMAHYIGSFDTEIEAAEKRDIWVVHRPDYETSNCNLNFPEKLEWYKTQVPYEKKEKKKYIGTTKDRSKFRAICEIDGTGHCLKSFLTEIEAARAYDKFVVEKKLYRKINFPAEHPEHEWRKPVEKIDDDGIECKILISRKHNTYSLIDSDLYESIKYAELSCTAERYAYIRLNNKTWRLHRYIMNVTDADVFVDHVNSDRLDNRRGNLRLSNAAQNAQNLKKQDNVSSKFLGISKHRNKYRATVMFEYKTHARVFDNEEDAARYRDLYVMCCCKDSHSKLNYEWTGDLIHIWKLSLNFDSLVTTTKKPRTSEFKGVSKHSNAFVSVITHKNVVHSKRFDIEEHAARYRDLYILEFHPELASKLNFNDWSNECTVLWKLVTKFHKKCGKVNV